MDIRETCIGHTAGDKEIEINTSERKWVQRIKKLAEKHPEARIVYENEDGSIYAKAPEEWLRIVPKVKRTLTEEQKKEVYERLHGARRQPE